MKQISYIELGGTLFTPASNKAIATILHHRKYPTLKSIVIDFEDGLNQQYYDKAFQYLQQLLQTYTPNKLLVFIRPNSYKSLQELLSITDIKKIDGFILPKFSLNNAHKYIDILKYENFYVMPSIEGEELFDTTKLQTLRSILLPYKNKILSIRVGCEDMLRQLSLFRQQNESIFDRNITANLFSDVIKTFKPYGFNISGCVYKYFKDEDGFLQDVQKDLNEGLFSKTIIHPNQIEPINELYKVTKDELQNAKTILSTQETVFNLNGAMGEKSTQTPFAEFILKRAEIYGIKD